MQHQLALGLQSKLRAAALRCSAITQSGTRAARFLRGERRVIVPLPAAPNQVGVTRFFIRADVQPRSRLSDLERRALADAVAHMPLPVRRDKS
jgi:hypothetical protein